MPVVLIFIIIIYIASPPCQNLTFSENTLRRGEHLKNSIHFAKTMITFYSSLLATATFTFMHKVVMIKFTDAFSLSLSLNFSRLSTHSKHVPVFFIPPFFIHDVNFSMKR